MEKPQWRHVAANPLSAGKGMIIRSSAQLLLHTMALLYNHMKSLRQNLKTVDGWHDFTIGFRTENKKLELAAAFYKGTMTVCSAIPENADAVLEFMDEATLMRMLQITPNEVLNLILENRMVLHGNLSALQLFNYLVSALVGRRHQARLEKNIRRDRKERKRMYDQKTPELSVELTARKAFNLRGEKTDPGVKYLDDPCFSGVTLLDFPRLKSFHERFFSEKPAICAERAEWITAWHRTHGFETDRQGNPWDPLLRQAAVFRHLMASKKALIRKDDLVAGTTTSMDTLGVVIYPDAQGTMAWGELGSIGERLLNPYTLDRATATTLHHDIFPFWMKRNFREWVRTRFDHPLCQQLEERWVAYFVWKSVGVSHTIPDFRRILEKGTLGLKAEIAAALKNQDLDASRRNTLSAMATVLSGLEDYADHLAREAERLANVEENMTRRFELERLNLIFRSIPRHPAKTLDEAVNAVNIVWIALNMENANTGLSFGRLDQVLQPYFLSDMARLESEMERKDYIRHALELVGCLFFRFSDHLPLSPDIGNYLFGGASATQALTVGGVTPDGGDAVNDMTYIMIKAVEMLGLRDVNLNARFHPEVNSRTYLKRLCDVNIITAGTPSMHNDKAVFRSLAAHGYPVEDLRDWAATGCVEPTLCGKHMGHTGSILFNLVAPFEMALNDGYHPLMRRQAGPSTGRVEDGAFPEFEDFFKAFETQLHFMIGQAVSFNNMLSEIHAEYRPTPFLSSLMDGPVENARDVTRGGALYNTSGTSNIGLTDVVDSLLALKCLVYDTRKVTFTRMKRSVDKDFSDDPVLLALIARFAPRFGSGHPEALAMARRITRLIHGIHRSHSNFRGGSYTTGFWSMSQHVAYGALSGALPSGRRKGKAFTPGLTPHPSASSSLLDNLKDVARLDPETMDNNIAFNVKLNLAPNESRERNVELMESYVKTYFDLGGMQLQFNMVTSKTLKDAMANPENYRHLMVRISGYNAYFVSLNRDIQTELVERAEFGLYDQGIL
jgi:formate C-acetyltransferase